jgi:hypothetical protein
VGVQPRGQAQAHRGRGGAPDRRSLAAHCERWWSQRRTAGESSAAFQLTPV